MRAPFVKAISIAAVSLALLGCTVFSSGPFSLVFDPDAATQAAETNAAGAVFPTATFTPAPPTSGVRPTAQIIPTATVDPNAADLTITALAAIGTGVNPRCGENTRVDFAVENRGVGAASAHVFYLTDTHNSLLTASAIAGVPPLNPGETYRGSINIIVGPPANVEHTLQAQVDSEFTVTETDESNNFRFITYNVDDGGNCSVPVPTATPPDFSRPNLVVESLSIAGGAARCGENTRVDFTVRNIGTAAAPANTLSLRDTHNNVTLTESFFGFTVIQPGERMSSSLNIVIPGPASATHTLTAVADGDGLIWESDETDNARVITFNLEDGPQCSPAPTGGTNLILHTVSITSTSGGVNPRCGEPSRVDFTVRNGGTQAAAAFVIGFTDYVTDTTDFVSLTQFTVPGLQAGTTFSGTTSIVMGRPPNVLHSLYVAVDYSNLVAETNEGDNARTLTFNVDEIGLCP